MPVSRIMCGTILLHVVLCLPSVPVPSRSGDRYKSATEWPEKSHDSHLKKKGALPHAQDTLKESRVRGHLHGGLPLRSGSTPGQRPRCGVPDSPGYGGQRRQRRFVLSGGKWPKNDLTYKIVHFPNRLSQEKVRWAMKEAQQIWSKVSQLTLTEVSDGHSDITIDFLRLWHGDEFPFDGPGGVLAHAFFPRTPKQGNIHFDADENWTVRQNAGMDLLNTATHEFGHALGLHHSKDPDAIMSPFYTFTDPVTLTEDDKRGIQAMYGTRPPAIARPNVRKETNEITPSKPDACHTDFDAVSFIRGDLFFFKSSYVWRIRDGHLQAGYPALTSYQWDGIPKSIDAAFEDIFGMIWFFQGHNFWVYNAENLVRGPELVKSLGLPVFDIQATFTWSKEMDQRTYIFKDDKYWLFNPSNNQVESPHPYSTQNWKGLPRNIDAAFLDQQGYANFLSGRQYWKFDPVKKKVLEGYPRYIGTDFFGC